MAQAWDSTLIFFNNFDLDNPDPINLDDIAHFGFNINFYNDNSNNVINPSSADFDPSLEDTLKEAGLSLGPLKTLQEAYTSSVSHLSPLKLANKNSDALTLTEASIPGNSTCQEPVSTHSNEMHAQKQKKKKKTDEVDKDCILPEGLC